MAVVFQILLKISENCTIFSKKNCCALGILNRQVEDYSIVLNVEAYQYNEQLSSSKLARCSYLMIFLAQKCMKYPEQSMEAVFIK